MSQLKTDLEPEVRNSNQHINESACESEYELRKAEQKQKALLAHIARNQIGASDSRDSWRSQDGTSYYLNIIIKYFNIISRIFYKDRFVRIVLTAQ